MKKKILAFLILMSIFFCIPMKETKAPTLTIADPEGDVVLIHYSVTLANMCESSVDIKQLEFNSTNDYITFSFYGVPVIDNIHVYNVTVFWEPTGMNRTEGLAGHIENGFSNKTRSVERNSSGYLLNEFFGDPAYVINDTLYFPLFEAAPTKRRDMSSAFDAGGIAGVAAEEDETTPVTPNPEYGLVDACGFSTHVWIPWPDEEGAIELPIVLAILGTSFVVIMIIRRRRK